MLVTKVILKVSVPRKMYSSSYNIPYSNVLSEDLRACQLFSAFPFFYGTLYSTHFITVSAEAQHWILDFIEIQRFIPSTYILIISFLLAITLQFLLFRFSDYINMNSLSVTYYVQLYLIISYITLLRFDERLRIPHILYSLSYPLEH